MERVILYSILCIQLLIIITLVFFFRRKPLPIATDYIPITTDDNHQVLVKLVSEKPRIMIYKNFLTPDECNHLISLADGRLKRSEVQATKSDKISKERTSHSCYMKAGEDQIIKKIEMRASTFANLPCENLEPLQVVRYFPGQYYNAHYDFFVSGADGTEEALKRGGQRRVTFFVYLNELDSEDIGGCTYFEKLDFRVKPERGTAVFWLDCTPDGKEDYLTYHAGEPPMKGVKYGLNIWFRESKFS